MKFKIKDTKLLKDLINAVSVINSEVTMKISEGGILIRLMDPSRVAMIELDVTKAVFEEWDCPENLKLGVNLSDLMKLLRRSGKEDATTIEWDKATGKLKVAIASKQYSKAFTVPTLEPSEEEVPTPKISFNAQVKFVTEDLKSVLEDALLVSDHMTITTIEDGLEVDAKGDLMTAHMTLNKPRILDFSAKEQCKATSSLKYMMDVINAASSLADIGVLEYSTDMPFKFSFEKDAVIRLTYWIAPRIETD